MLEPYQGRRTQSRRGQASNQSLEPFSGTLSRKQNNFMRDDSSDIFSMHDNMISAMDKRFENMQSKIMKRFDNPFGGSLMENFSAPFKMFDQVSKHMDNMFANFSDLHHGMMSGGGQGTSVQKVFTMQRRIGADKQPYEEKYFSNNIVQRDNAGNTISERQQAYKNTAEKRDAIAQERMLNSQGRKFVQERINGNTNSTNHYLNLEERDAGRFDDDWNSAQQLMGFFQNNQKSLGMNGGRQQQRLISDREQNSFPKNRSSYQQPKNTRPQKDYKEYDFQDEGRHGDFIPSSVKREGMPVRINRGFDGYGRKDTDLQPTQPQSINRALPIAQSNTANNANSSIPVQNNYNQRQSQPQAARNTNYNSAPVRQSNPVPMRNAAEQGVFANRNVAKGSIPKAG